MASAVDSGGADLDSLDASGSVGRVKALYQLEALFVEGFAGLAAPMGAPAAGRQLAFVPVGDALSAGAGSDSVVVRSGYFQLRSPPGLYRLESHWTAQEPANLRVSHASRFGNRHTGFCLCAHVCGCVYVCVCVCECARALINTAVSCDVACSSMA